jgi:hypothetical protein
MFGMTDRPTDPTDRPALRPSAPGQASVNGHRPTVEPTAVTDSAPTDRPASWATNLAADARRRFTDRAARRATVVDAKKTADRRPPTAPPSRPASTVEAGRPADSTNRSGSRPTGTAAKVGIAALLTTVAVLLAVVIAAPIALSAQDLIEWAASPTGLGLGDFWALIAFIALDAAAAVCVLLSVYCAWRGEPAGSFGLFVWVFALTSAFANYRHGSRPGAPTDAWWFFPAMSVLGPALLEMVTRKVREWVQRGDNRRGRRMPHFGWRRWIPGIGSWRDTYGAYRTANLLGIETVDLAIAWYHWLCPTGSLRVAKAMRERGVAADRLPTGPTDRPGPETSTPIESGPGRPAAATVDRSTASRPTVPAPREPRPTAAPTVDATNRPAVAPRTVGVGPTDSTDRPAHTPAAVANARYLREHYRLSGLPSLGTIRGELRWSFDRAKPAVAAYNDGADLPSGNGPATRRESADDPKEGSSNVRPFAVHP